MVRPEKESHISVGVLITVWRLIFLAKRYENLAVKTAIDIIQNTGMFGGGVPVLEALRTAQRYELITIASNSITLTEFCKREVSVACDQEEPNIDVFRAVLFHIIKIKRCHWVLFFNNDAEVFKGAIPRGWIDLLDCAQLFEFADHDVVEWWASLLRRYNEDSESEKKEIGDVGERLTFDFETNRLHDDDVERPDFFVKWASKFSNKFGYDLLSIRGNLFKLGRYFDDVIQIEVKASVMSNESAFRFKISKNEWNTALNNMDSYYFYCWLGINLSEGKAKSGPFAISVKSLIDYIPQDIRNEICEWTECRFLLDLRKHGMNLCSD